MERNGRTFFLVPGIGLICLGFVSLGLVGCATSPAKTSAPVAIAEAGGQPAGTRPTEPGTTGPQEKSPQPAAAETPSIQDRWGIEIVAIRLSAAGQMLDFRYRVIGPDKAGPILDPKVKPYLIDQKSGAKFTVPITPKVGSLRQTSRSGPPQTNRIYFILFSNPGRSVQVGDKVTVVIGDFRAEDLIVQ
jgi:hypothetical protein